MFRLMLLIAGLLCYAVCSVSYASERIKDLTRFSGWRENQLIGYGLVTGLAGSGDTPRSYATRQSVANMLKQFELNLEPGHINSRNVAAVMVTANLPPLFEPGSQVDVTVTSMGDARSLTGGTLLQTPLKGMDGKVYVLAQGALSVGGYRFDSYGSRRQKNHPTVGRIPAGGIVEHAVSTRLVQDGKAHLQLINPDITTAKRIAQAINQAFGQRLATALDASKIELQIATQDPARAVDLLSQIENIYVQPDSRNRVVINERTGTVAAGGDVRISSVTIAHGNLKVSIDTDYLVSQPGGVIVDPSRSIRSTVVPETTIDVQERSLASIQLKGQSTIADLVAALNKINATPRDMIAVLQAIHTAGALHAELIIQ